MDREYMGGTEVVPWIANMILYFLVNIFWFLSTNILTNIYLQKVHCRCGVHFVFMVLLRICILYSSVDREGWEGPLQCQQLEMVSSTRCAVYRRFHLISPRMMRFQFGIRGHFEFSIWGTI